jgi:hypothetical protein
MTRQTGMPRSQVTLVLVILVVVVEPLTCIGRAASMTISVTLPPCAQRPATASAISWRSLPWALALWLTFTVVADFLPARGWVSVEFF